MKFDNINYTLCDPCAGVGTMLLYAVKKLGYKKENCYGIELDELNVAVCHKLGFVNIIQGDASDPKTWEKFGKNMKFDRIIMNPPYNGNLHLKILREAVKHADEVVNLSPIRWLQDPLAERKENTDYKKFSDIRKHIDSIDEISGEDAVKLFGAAFYTDLGIYKLDKKEHNFEYKRDAFIEKMLDTFAKGPRFTYENKMSGEYELVLPAVHGNLGKNDWSEITSKDWNVAVNVKASSVTNGYVILRFDSKDERKNFYDSLFTKFYRFFVGKLKTTAATAQYIKFLPMMPTYTHPWTDEMLYDYFDLTQEERETIENELYTL